MAGDGMDCNQNFDGRLGLFALVRTKTRIFLKKIKSVKILFGLTD
jgi:hypothetical protein